MSVSIGTSVIDDRRFRRIAFAGIRSVVIISPGLIVALRQELGVKERLAGIAAFAMIL
jgi:hypothetical protein